MLLISSCNAIPAYKLDFENDYAGNWDDKSKTSNSLQADSEV